MEISLTKIGVSHEDERRRLTAVMNGEFAFKQIKMLEIKRTSVLGNHYHDYIEMFYIYRGRATFTLMDVETKERGEVVLEAGDRLIIAPKIAHKVVMTKGTFTVEATEQTYESPEKNDVRYEIE